MEVLAYKEYRGFSGGRIWNLEEERRRRQVQRVAGRKQQKTSKKKKYKSSVADGRQNKNKTTKLVVNFSGATLETEIDLQGHQFPTSLSSARQVRKHRNYYKFRGAL